jgi:aerotolerance regulator-like protein/VWA domain-containing protein/von Willebrand factor type A domain-containing protein
MAFASFPIAFLFLAPWTAVATLVGAASIPIIIHLLNRKRYRVVNWAAMRFLQMAQKKTTRKLRIEQWLLLAIRTLLIILLVLAMVSVLPWIEPLWGRVFPSGVAGGPVRSGRTHRIIVIDGSYSMARRHADGSSFERAVRLAKEIVQGGNPGDGFSLILLSAPAQSIVPGPSDNSSNFIRELESLRLPHGNSDLASGLTAVEKMVTEPLGKYHQREVYILTDLQRTFFQAAGVKVVNSRADSDSRTPDEADPWQRIQSRASVIVVDVAREGADNLAVANVSLGEPLALVNSLNSVTAVIRNFGTADRNQVKVDLLVGKALPEPVEGKPAGEPFSLRVQQELLVDVPAGAAVPATFPFTFTEPGEYVVQVRTESDVLDLDDSRSLIAVVKESIPVLLVNGKPAAERDDQATHHLAIALNPGGDTPNPISPFRPKIITEAQFADRGLGDLDPYDCVFICDVARLSERKITAIENYLRRGGGVIFSLGGQVDPEAYQRLLYKNGEGILPARLVGRVRAPENQHFTLTADDENFQQSPLSAFKADNDRATLLSAMFREYYRVELPPNVAVKKWLSFLPPSKKPDGPEAGAARTQLDPAVLEWQWHRGRVILITTTVNIDWGSWPGSPAFLPFMHELVRHAALGSPPRVVTAGDPLVEYLPTQFARVDGTISTPDGRTATVTVRDEDEMAVVRFPETDQSGIYRLTLGASPREFLFAVNVPISTSTAVASESDLSRVSTAELEAGSPSGNLQVVTQLAQIRHRAHAAVSEDDGDGSSRSSAGPMVAHYLLLAFVVLLVLEMILAWRFGSARTVVPPEGVAAPPRLGLFAGLLRPSALSFLPLALTAVLAATLVHESFTEQFLGFLPSSLRAPLERELGVPAASPGEGTRWRLEYLSYLTGDPSSDRWLVFGVLAGLAALAVVIYRYERIASRVRVPGDATPANRSLAPLAGMRLALLFLTLIVLLPQLRLFFEREGWPDVVILIDSSKSFSVRDDYQDPKIKDRAEELGIDWSRLAASKISETRDRIARLETERAGKSSDDRISEIDRELASQQDFLAELQSPSRLNLVKALVAGKDSDWLSALLSRHQVKVHVYECSNQAARLAEVIDVNGANETVTKIRNLRPLGESSQLGGAVRAVLNDFRGGSLGAIVMLTDGITTEGDDLVQAGRQAARADVPLFFVGVGDAQEPRDLLLHDLQADDTVNVHDRLVFDVRVSVKGKIQATSVPIKLWEKDKNGELLERDGQTVSLDPDKPVKVRLVTKPNESGDHTYVISVPEQPDETDKSNNRVEKVVSVVDAKPVKVLYIEGYPRYEYRFIKTLLEREQATKLGNKMIQIKVLLVDADPEYAIQDKSAITEIPSREELFGFDAIILGDVDPKSPGLANRKNLELLRDFVREKGGGMLFIAGDQNMPQAYRDTPLADILPITWGGAGEIEDPAERRILEDGDVNGYELRLTGLGQQHPIFRFATEDADNAAIWNQLAPLHFAAAGYRVKPAAEVLATHPVLKARHSPGEEESLHPLAVQSFVGAGRTMFFGFDETWRWRFRENEPRFNQFWLQTINYLSRTRLGRVDLHLDRQTPYRRNEPIRVTVRFPDDSPAPAADATVSVLKERSRLRQPGNKNSEILDTESVQLTKVKGSRATYEALLTRTPEGEYKFWLTAPTVDGPKPQVEGRVLPPPGEMDRLRMNQTDMEQAARESRGKFYSLADADNLLDDLPNGTRVTLNQPRPPWPLWNHALMFLLVIGLFTSEWIMRKRRRLL